MDFAAAPPLGYISTQGMSNVKVDDAWRLSGWATPSKRVLMFEIPAKQQWVPTPTPMLRINQWVSTSGYSRLAFRMCQIFDLNIGNTSGTPLAPNVSGATSIALHLRLQFLFRTSPECTELLLPIFANQFSEPTQCLSFL